MSKPKNAAEHPVSAQGALRAFRNLHARGGNADVLHAILSGLKDTADGRLVGVELSALEATLLLEDRARLVSDLRAARSQLGVMEQRRNDALERAGKAEDALQKLRG